MCGEKALKYIVKAQDKGSPPRVRGKVLGAEEIPLREGITPACAGKRIPALAASDLARDHPRVCGEKLATFLLHFQKRGSPPRVRGKGWALFAFLGVFGITPACAGKS